MNEIDYCSRFNPDASETVAYNNPLFPVYVRYGILSTYPDYSAVSHWHRDLEFIKILKGQMTYNVNGKLIELAEQDGIMVGSRQLHYGFSAQRRECEFICILLSPELLQGNRWFYENFVERIADDPACPFRYLEETNWTGEILGLMDEIYRLYGAAPAPYGKYIVPKEYPAVTYFAMIEIFSHILRLLHTHLEPLPSAPGHSADLAALRSMVSYIEEHYAQPLTLGAIAKSGVCCKSRCSLLFKKYLCDTPITYATRLRLSRSLTPLLESDRSITDIAYEHGFGGSSYYCETFKKYYGISPLAYRNRYMGSLMQR